MRKNIEILFILLIPILTIFSFTSCQKSDDVNFEDLPVIEAYLSPGKNISVKISQKTPYEGTVDTTSTEFDHLAVYVVYGNKKYQLIPIGEGVYTDTLSVLPVFPDSIYTLQLVYHDLPVSSTTVIPLKPTDVTLSDSVISMYQIDPDDPPNSQPDPVEISWTNTDESYYLVTVECLEANLVPIIKDSVPTNDIFASQPVTNSELSIQPMMFRYFGKNRIILYHINPEYSIFFMRQASNSQSFEEPPSNIENGLGIFTGINADTLYIRIIQK